MEPLVKDDIDRYAAKGVHIDAEAVVRLEDAARKLKSAKTPDGSPLLLAPRCRWVGGVLLHEPTVQSELWMQEVAEPLAEDGRSCSWLLAFSLAHAVEPGFFDTVEMRTPKEVQSAAKGFQRSLAATETELWAAVEWCMRGDDAGKCADAGEEDASSDPDEDRRNAIYAHIAEAVGVSGASLADIKTMTPSMLLHALRRVWEMHGTTFRNCALDRATRDWYRVTAEISAAASLNNSGE